MKLYNILMVEFLCCLIILFSIISPFNGSGIAVAANLDQIQEVDDINVVDNSYGDYPSYEEFREARNEEIIAIVNKRFDRIEERKEKEEQERIERENSYNLVFDLSYYGLSAEENGGYEGITCTNSRLEEGMVASNVWDLGTIIEFEDGTRVVVADRGGDNFNTYDRLDVFVATYSQEYLLNLGRKIVKGKIINNKEER